MVTALLDAGADVNGLGGNQIPPLRFAIGNNKGREVIDRLLEEGADPECDGSAWTALHEATCVGKIDLVGDLLSRGAKLDALTQDGRTALGVAADANQTEMMRFLLEKGIGPDEGENEWTPLMAAARHDNGEGVRMLLEAGANEDRRAPFPWDRFDNTKRSALEHAQAKGAKNAMSAFSGQRGDRFATLRQAVEANDLEEARRMLARGDEVNPEAEPPLSAVKSEEMLRVLLEAGAEVNRSDDKGATPLMTVAASELPDASEMAEMLIDNGAKVDSKDQRKETALHYAARAGNLEVARKLIEKGATVDFKYHTPLHVAARAGHAEMCRFLLKKGARHDIFDLASYFGRRTPLHEAAAQGHTDVAEILLEAGADPAVQDPTEGDDYDESYWAHGGYNAIHLAAEGGHYETLKRLLAHDQKGGVFMQVARRKYAHELAEDHPQCQALIQAVTDDKSTVEGFEEKQRAEIQEAERQLQAALKGSDPFVLQVAEPELYHGVSKTTGAFTLGPGDWAMTNGADKSIVLKSSRGEYVLAVGDEHGLHDLPVELRARSFPFEFSPDGFELLVHADGRLYLIDTRTRSMTKLIESKRTLGSFGFAGEHVFVQVGKQLKLFSLEDGSIEEIWKIPLRKEIGDTFCTGTPFVGFRLADDKSSVVFCVLDEEGFHHHSKLAKTVVQSWFIRREGRPTSTISFMRSDWVDSRCEWYQIQNHRQLEVGAPEKSALGARALKKLPETTFIKSPAIVELPR
jgi:ankyrin repeat protein